MAGLEMCSLGRLAGYMIIVLKQLFMYACVCM